MAEIKILTNSNERYTNLMYLESVSCSQPDNANYTYPNTAHN